MSGRALSTRGGAKSSAGQDQAHSLAAGRPKRGIDASVQNTQLKAKLIKRAPEKGKALPPPEESEGAHTCGADSSPGRTFVYALP